MPPPSTAPVRSSVPAWKSRVLMSLTRMPHPAAQAASTRASALPSASTDAASPTSNAAIADGDIANVSATSATTWPHKSGSQAASANSGCTSRARGRSQPSSIASGERRWRERDTFTLSGEKRWNSRLAASSGSRASSAEAAHRHHRRRPRHVRQQQRRERPVDRACVHAPGRSRRGRTASTPSLSIAHCFMSMRCPPGVADRCFFRTVP
jgi:hypothetical protein